MTPKKRKTSWNDKYCQEFGFLRKVQNDDSKAFCTLCSSQFSIANGGRRDITQHIETNRHQSCIKAGSSSKKVSEFFKQIVATKDELTIAAKESTFAFHTAMHNLSSRSNDCSANLIRCFFEPKSIPNDQSTTIYCMLMDVIHSCDLSHKIVAYSADNTNLNFGGLGRQGRNNVWRKMQSELNRNLIGNGCNAHIAHNAITAGCEILDVDIEATIVKLYKHFSIYSVRTESFMSLCDEMKESYNSLLNHANTRFLSLDPAVRRLIELFEPLKEYFLTLKSCPPLILKFFNDPASKFWILFISNQLTNCHNFDQHGEIIGICILLSWYID